MQSLLVLDDNLVYFEGGYPNGALILTHLYLHTAHQTPHATMCCTMKLRRVKITPHQYQL